MAKDVKGGADEAPASEASTAQPSRIDQVVQAWFVEKIQNSNVSRDTETYNHHLAAVEDLKRRLAQA